MPTMLATLTFDSRSDVIPVARFTLDGSDALENQLADICKKILAGIGRIIPQNRLEGIALGGGYGRGEGGVLKTSLGDQPYNDLEFYVFVGGHSLLNERRYAKALHELSLELTPVAGVELEFKITSLEKLRRSPPSLFYHDLVMGHQWILGDEDLFAGCEHHCRASRLPLSEATRLLMNRCSGLLFAREKLEQKNFTSEDSDFVCRNLAKTELALGDTVLIAMGKYHWSCLVRGERLRDFSLTGKFPWLAEVRKRHSAGIKFKLQPHRRRCSREALQDQFRAVSSLALELWLWLENCRLGSSFESAADYASTDINKWRDGNSWRNRLANVKVFGPRALLAAHNGRHPRNRILNALTLLLWARSETFPGREQKVQRELLLPRRSAIIPAYRERWRRAS